MSHQAKRAATRLDWGERVKRASYNALPESHFATDGPIAVTIYFFADGEMQGDIDNIVKPILDSLCRHIYFDDQQVERVWVQKFEPGRLFQFSTPSPTLAAALTADKPLVFIRVSDNPLEGLL